MGKAIVVTSGKGGVGKTTCAANVAASLARRNKKVVVVDGDTDMFPHIGIHLMMQWQA